RGRPPDRRLHSASTPCCDRRCVMREEDYQELTARIGELRRRTEAAKQAEVAAETRRAVASALANYGFRDRQCKSDLHQLVCQVVRPDDDGEYADKDGTPLSEVIRREYDRRPRYHAEGNVKPQQTVTTPNEKEFDLTSINANMTPA